MKGDLTESRRGANIIRVVEKLRKAFKSLYNFNALEKRKF